METARPRHTPKQTPLEAVDLLRGLLMILMVVDHTRIYFTNVRFNPTDPLLSWPALFATRWQRKWTDARCPAWIRRSLMTALLDATSDYMIQDAANGDKHCMVAFDAFWRMIA